MSRFVRPFGMMVLVSVLGMAGSAAAGAPNVCGNGTIDKGEECDSFVDTLTGQTGRGTDPGGCVGVGCTPGCSGLEVCLSDCTCGCVNDADCDDGVACTIDNCVEKSGACEHDDSACLLTTTTTEPEPTTTTTEPEPTTTTTLFVTTTTQFGGTTTTLLITTTTIPLTTTTTEPPPTTTTTLPPPSCDRDCGDPAGAAGTITALDAQFILRTAVELEVCGLCVCDIDDSGEVLAVDALGDLQLAVGLPVVLDCPTVEEQP